MLQLIHDFTTNLRAGLSLASFLRCKQDDFKFSLDQLALLLTLDLCLEIAADFIRYLPNPVFSDYALPTYAFSLGCFLLAAYVIGKLARDYSVALRIGIVVYSFAPLTILLLLVIGYVYPPSDSAEASDWPYLAFSLYVMVLLCRALHIATGRSKRFTAAAYILMLLAINVPQRYFADYDEFWFAAEEKANAEEDSDPYAEYRDMDAEDLLYRQPEILANTLNELKPQRENVTDLFFVGFAGYAHEDVFAKEAAYVKQMLDERFDTQGHSINLINHLETRDSVPLATATNLALTLQRIAELMDPEEDVLLLYLTSHGSENHEIAVDFWPLPLNPITPEKLNAMLNEAGIKLRAVIVSACYSGTYVHALKSPGTLVASASAADRTSFGCGNEFDFTYFGEEVFKHQLQKHFSLTDALKQARIAIGVREVSEKLEPSLPQISIGAAIAPKLQRLSESLHEKAMRGG